jgi:hypothetical protein
LFPQPGSEFIDADGRMHSNTLQDVDEIITGTDLVQAAGGQGWLSFRVVSAVRGAPRLT